MPCFGERAIGLLTTGMPTRAVAIEFNVNFSIISHLQHNFIESVSSFREFVSSPTCLTTADQVYGVVWAGSLMVVNIVNRVSHGGDVVMVWAGLSYRQRAQLHFIDGNLIPWWDPEAHCRSIHPPSSPHVSRIFTQFLEAENVPVLPWPAYSPDMSPIENIWDALDRRVRQCVPVPANIQQVCTAIEEECDNIPQATIKSLINSMPMRCVHAWGKWWSHQILTGFLIHTPTFILRYLWPTEACLYSLSCEMYFNWLISLYELYLSKIFGIVACFVYNVVPYSKNVFRKPQYLYPSYPLSCPQEQLLT
jgi:hypothetical protein